MLESPTADERGIVPPHAVLRSPLCYDGCLTNTDFYQKAECHGQQQMQYLRKTNASPAANLFEVTKVLHPVVSKCLRG